MNRWYTKEDVMKDLAFANVGTNLHDDYDSFIISGSCPPPPPRQLNEDDEFEERFGRFGGHDESLKPDLQGITAMVRMVNDDSLALRKENLLPKKPEEISRIVISKLNPCVPEFVPKQDINLNKNNDSSSFATNGRIEDSSKIFNNQCAKEESVLKNEMDTNDSIQKVTEHDTLEPCENSDLNDDEDDQQGKKESEAMLKGNIIEAAKAKTFSEKKARNLAIAALLKLKCGPPPSPTTPLTNSSSESKLSSFDSPVSRDSNSSPSPKQTLVLHPPTFYEAKCSTTAPENEISMPQSSESDSTSEENNKSADKKEDTTANLNSEAVVASPEVDRVKQQSIQKVMEWLDNPKEPKPFKAPNPLSPITYKKKDPAPHLGPIVYKRKEPCKSPVSDSNKSQTSETRKKVSQPPAFVPTQYASELVRKYEERAKVKENVQLDLWSKLERDLKAKDEAIRQRMHQDKAEASLDASRSSSRCSSERN